MKDNSKEIIDNITVVLVLYRSTQIVFELIENIKNFKILIVDNGGNKKILEKVKSKNLNISIISKNKNIGYGQGINFAYNYVKTKFFLVLNPDLIITSKNIKKLYNTIVTNQNCVITAPVTKPDIDFYGTFPEIENFVAIDSCSRARIFTINLSP